MPFEACRQFGRDQTSITVQALEDPSGRALLIRPWSGSMRGSCWPDAGSNWRRSRRLSPSPPSNPFSRASGDGRLRVRLRRARAIMGACAAGSVGNPAHRSAEGGQGSSASDQSARPAQPCVPPAGQVGGRRQRRGRVPRVGAGRAMDGAWADIGCSSSGRPGAAMMTLPPGPVRRVLTGSLDPDSVCR